jgi:hypothetical protein
MAREDPDVSEELDQGAAPSGTRRHPKAVMSQCAMCGQPAAGPGEICLYHLSFPADDWATGNRVMCNFLHRGIVPAGSRARSDDLDVFVELLDEAIG